MGAGQAKKVRRRRRPLRVSTALVAERWARRIRWWQRRLQPRLPDIPPDDLAQILACLFQPREVPRRWLLRKVADGRYAL